MRQQYLMTRVVAYLRERPGKSVHFERIADAIDVEPRKVSESLARLVRERREGIIRDIPGVYLYAPGSEPTGPQPGDKFVHVGLMNGKILVRCPITHDLYTLEKM